MQKYLKVSEKLYKERGAFIGNASNMLIYEYV
jgi:hypothetical protein